jgi:hypothetical protein
MGRTAIASHIIEWLSAYMKDPGPGLEENHVFHFTRDTSVVSDLMLELKRKYGIAELNVDWSDCTIADIIRNVEYWVEFQMSESHGC